MNMEVFRLINNLASRNAALDETMIFFSKYVQFIFMGIVALIFIMGVVKKNEDYRKASVSTFIITVINLILSFIIGAVYYENRPFVNNKVNLLVPHVEDASFPSDHAIGTMSIALGLNRCNRIFGIVLTALSLVVGFSRIYVGNHYPSDVIGGYIIVIITNYLYNSMLRNKIEKLYIKVEKFMVSKLGFSKNMNEDTLK